MESFRLKRLKNQKSVFIFFLAMSMMFAFNGCRPKLIPPKKEVAPRIAVIPKPASTEERQGMFEMTPGFYIQADTENEEIRTIGEYFAAKLRRAWGQDVPVVDISKEGQSEFTMMMNLSDPAKNLGREGYELEINPTVIRLEAEKPAGLFYGIQTLLQLLPPEIESEQGLKKNIRLTLPCLKIRDIPRYRYRGMHLDVGRHFFPKSFIKKYIDLLALHKFNTFHWHLTEDQGWRVEIKKYPSLTEVGGYRNETLVGHYREQPHMFNGRRYGGYYTQEDIREIVEYAQSRYVTIIPEIEMPGHSVAALAAYPELSCTGGPFEVATKWGIFEDIYCAGNDKVFEFLEDILSEIIELFPGTYIHIGGDEAPKARWKNCDRCQNRIKEEGLEDEHELQSYFIQRIEEFLLSRGRKLIGWDEILEGGLAPEATVMSWRGVHGGIEAAKQGHDVIMTPTSHCYFDYYQGDSKIEPLAIGGYTTLQKVYSFEPTPEELTPEEEKYILGAQGNVWTEYIRTPEKAEYMSVPRMSALAEVVWSPREVRNWVDFRRRLERHFMRLEEMNVNYSKGSFRVEIGQRYDPETKRTSIILETEQLNPEVFFTLDGSDPSPKSRKYEKPIPFLRTMTLRAGIFKDGKLQGYFSEKTFIHHKGIYKDIKLLTPYQERYSAGGDRALIDSETGSEQFRDGSWQGYEGDDLIAVIDLKKTEKLRKIAVRFLQDGENWIFLPGEVVFALSDDGENFRTVATVKSQIPKEQGGVIIEEFSHRLSGEKARYVRVQAKNIGLCPDWHPGSGQRCWIFADEIVIK